LGLGVVRVRVRVRVRVGVRVTVIPDLRFRQISESLPGAPIRNVYTTDTDSRSIYNG
jgi:hypothetical protein